MSKKVYLFSLVLLTLFFVSCDETEEAGRYDNWQSRNEAYIDDLANTYSTAPNHGGLSRVEVLSEPGNYIYYKVVTEPSVSSPVAAEEQPSPKYTDWVSVYYKGTNILDEYFDGNFKGADPVINGPNAGEGDSTPVNFQVNSVITGWTEVLQRMKKGDRWKVYIPWKFAYGSEGSGSILGYSTLIFDLTLIDFANTKEELK